MTGKNMRTELWLLTRKEAAPSAAGYLLIASKESEAVGAAQDSAAADADGELVARLKRFAFLVKRPYVGGTVEERAVAAFKILVIESITGRQMGTPRGRV